MGDREGSRGIRAALTAGLALVAAGLVGMTGGPRPTAAVAAPPATPATAPGSSIPATDTATLARSLRISNRKLREASDWAPRHPTMLEGLRAIVDG